RVIVTGGADGTVKVWAAGSGQPPLTRTADGSPVRCVAVSADGRRVVAAGARTAKVWDLAGPAELTLARQAGAAPGGAVSADGGCVVSGGKDGTVRVWDAAAGRERHTLRGHAGPVYGVAVSGDGRHVLSGGEGGAVKLWDAVTGQAPLTLVEQGPAVRSV